MSRPFIVGIGGFTSGVGKTTLMCDLLRAFPGWEAIKTTRGHYRSCGRTPDACCVSDLLESTPVVRSGRAETYEVGKDTGRYWDAGASNVHWLIASDAQIDQGIHEALHRVRAEGVFIEGNSFSKFVRPDYFVMVRRTGSNAVKKSARTVMAQVSAQFISEIDDPLASSAGPQALRVNEKNIPVFDLPTIPMLVERIRLAVIKRSVSR